MTDNDTYPKLRMVPSTIKEAKRVVADLHRHLPVPPPSGRFALAVLDPDDSIRGVAIVGFGARKLNDRTTSVVTRVASDGTRNVCSMLYGGAARVWRTMGGRVLYTYTLEHESGTSLKAAGWKFDGCTDGGSWDRPSRSRDEPVEGGPKCRWIS